MNRGEYPKCVTYGNQVIVGPTWMQADGPQLVDGPQATTVLNY